MPTETLLKASVRADQSAMAACREAKALENIGEYAKARDALAPFWNQVGERPRIEGLSPKDQAELLLRAGSLSGWLGSSGQVAGAQQFAKDLISESLRRFEEQDAREKVAEARTDLAICYWREGAMDEARIWFQSALEASKDPANQLRALVNSTSVEVSTNHLDQARALLDRAASLLDDVADDAALGRFYMQRGIVNRRLGGVENLDRALLDHTAASVHFERAKHRRYFARAQNNIAVALLELGRCDEALQTLDEARRTFVEMGDVGSVAQLNDTRARVFLAQQRYGDAEKVAFSSASVLDRGGERSLLGDTLHTLGIAQARQGRHTTALTTLKRAAELADTAGDPESAGRALLTTLEELNSFLSAEQITNLYFEADRRLGEDLSYQTMKRLRECARLLTAHPVSAVAAGTSTTILFEEEVKQCESNLIKQALDQANGSVTRAARILGLTHQGLCYIINHRHKNLLASRAPIRVRRKSVIRK